METSQSTPTRFDNLDALTAAHVELLKQEMGQGAEAGDRALIDAVRRFLETGQATGAVLDDDQDRRATQSLLNYWVTVLYRAGVEPPNAILAPYDPQQAEKDLSQARCPYVGLNPFRAEDKEYFFGREKVTTEVVKQLGEKHLLVIIGPSGSGKSSLLHAGILPAIEAGQILPESKAWRRYPPITPGRTPLANLKLMLQSGRDGQAGGVPEAEAFKQSPTALLEYLDGADAHPSLVCVDQFEEIFTVCKNDEEREAFLNNLLSVVKAPDLRHRVVLTMRSDRAGYVLRRPELNESFHDAEVRLPPLTEEEMRSAIEGPARRVGLVFKPGVVEELIKEIYGDPSGLPLLQFTLLKLWEGKERGAITLAALRQLGDCREALAKSADKFYEGLEPAEKKEVARRVLLKMVRLSEGLEMTGNRVRREELYEAIKDRDYVDNVLQGLDDAHLVRVTKACPPAQSTGAAAGNGHGASTPSADDQFELAHECLMYNWPMLEDWLKEAREAMILQQHLESYVAEWVLRGRGQDALLDKYKLYEADRWLKQYDPSESAYGDDLRELVRMSRAATRKRRLIRFAATVALVVISVVAVLVAWQALSESRQAFSRQLAAQALLNKSERLDLALLLSLEAIKVENSDDISSVSSNSLLQSLDHSPNLITFLHPRRAGAEGDASPGVKGVAFDAAGSKLASLDEQGTVVIWDVESRSELRRFSTGRESAEVVGTAFSADGGTLALRYRSDTDDTVALWDVNGGQQLGEPKNISPPKKEAVKGGQRGGGSRGAREARSGAAVANQSSWDSPGYVEESDSNESEKWKFRITFSADGETLIAHYPDKTIVPWNVNGPDVKDVPVLSGQKRQPPEAGRRVLAQTLSPGLKKLAVINRDRFGNIATVEVRTADGGRVSAFQLPGILQNVYRIEALFFSPNTENVLACLYRDRENVYMLVLWDVEKRDVLFTSPIRPRNNSKEMEPLLAFSPNGRLAIASSVGNVTMLDGTREVDPEGLALLPTGSSGLISIIAFDPLGQKLAVGYRNGAVQLWDYSLPRERVGTLSRHTQEVSRLIFDTDGGRLVSASTDSRGGEGEATSRVVSGYGDDEQSGTPYSLEGALDISFSPDGKVAALNYGNRVVLRETSKGAERGEFKEEGKDITTTALSGEGSMLAVGFSDGSATVWEVTGGRRIGSLTRADQGESNFVEVSGIAVTADGTLCAVGDSGGVLRLWDVKTGETKPLIKGTGSAAVNGLVFSPDGKQLISLDEQRAITFWDIAEQSRVESLTVSGLNIVVAALSRPDGKLLMTAGAAGDGILWSMETHKQLGKISLNKANEDVSALAYRSKDNLLAVGYSSGEVLLFDISLKKLRQVACRIANRPLNSDELKQYHLSKGDWSRYFGSLGDWSRYFGGRADPTCSDVP